MARSLEEPKQAWIPALEKQFYLDEREEGENVLFRKDEDDEDFLNVHLDDCFSDQRSAEKCPKRDQKVATGDSSEVEKRVGDGSSGQDAEKADFLDEIMHENLSSSHHVQIG